MALLPTDKFVNAFYQDSIHQTLQRNVFVGSVQALTISDVTAADYTFTVGANTNREIRPNILVPITVTSGHFTHDVTITVVSDYHLVGDSIVFSWTPAQVVAGRTVTVLDNAASPNTLFTFTSTTSSTATQVSREIVLLPTGLWQLVSLPGASGAVQPGGSGASLTGLLVGTKVYDAASITAPNTTSTTVTVTGAAVGDYVLPTLTTLTTAAQITAYVSATNTVTVVVGAYTGTVDLASGTLNVLVIKAA